MTLFKYTTHFGLNVLRDLQLKVTPPNELNDPFEFTPYVGGRVTEDHIHDLIASIPPRDVYDEMIKSGEKLPPFEQFEEFAKRTPRGNLKSVIPIFQQSYESVIAAQSDLVSKRMGLICFSEQENDILLWSHYTDGHKGMLLEFNSSHQYFKLNSRFSKVKYTDTRVAYDPLWPDGGSELDRYAEEVLCTKNSVWAYENEWRSLFPLDWCHKKIIPSGVLHFTDIPPDLVSRVVLGFRCPDELQKQVLEVKKQRGLTFSVFRAFLHPNEFRVEYRSI